MTRLLLALLVCTACAPTRLLREDLPPRCAAPDSRELLQVARESLVFRSYHPKAIYDLDAQDRPVPFRPGPLPADALAILSYPYPERFAGGPSDFKQMAQRSFVYDNALAALWLTHDGDLARARRVLATLAALQRPDGAWGFGFNAGADDGYYNAAYVRTGTVAWVIYALVHYQIASHDAQFNPTLRRALGWLGSQREPNTRLYFAGSGRWLDAKHFEPTWPAQFFAMEHQIDTWFALAALLDLERADSFTALRLAVALRASRDALGRLVVAGEARFAQGLTADGQLDRESALDAAGTWSALWLLANDDAVRARQVLAWVATQHAITALGWRGLRPYLSQAPQTWFVEASIAEPLAEWRLGDKDQALQHWQNLAQLACAGGLPLVYAPDWHADFPLTPAAAPTLWFLIAGQEIVEGGAPWLWTER
jgi:hypothetical protein